MSDLAQGVVYTAIAKHGKPAAQVGTIDAGAPIEYSEFVALSSKSQSYNLYLGKVPKDGNNRQQEIEELFELAQKNAPLITKTVDIARSRVYKLQQAHRREPQDSDLQKSVRFVRGETIPGSEVPVDPRATTCLPRTT